MSNKGRIRKANRIVINAYGVNDTIWVDISKKVARELITFTEEFQIIDINDDSDTILITANH